MTPPARPAWTRVLLGAAQFLLFQAAWFACVLGAAHGRVALGVAAVAVAVIVNLGLSDRRRADLALTALAILIGLAWDTWMLRGGWVLYASPGPVASWAPAWILALWALFATLLRGPLSWLHARPLLAAVMGAVGGPLSYLAAVRLGAGHFPDAAYALSVLALGWALITPLLIEAARLLSSPCRRVRLSSSA